MDLRPWQVQDWTRQYFGDEFEGDSVDRERVRDIVLEYREMA